ncbi:APC family permease [Amycolatopsis sp. FDAARGOS 1241]|uniref:APC family permease n=1 Tax=Amycolatopsis sp. FDAARGOS 1241 TaxID=2778070 RepID=UPI00195069D3|nr:APC family permease [Amycolatopsis sp. FDAARGOS 1241]QRP44580.1 APC family permease [Amycolatopsis sp. FDAARGOS 1241]
MSTTKATPGARLDRQLGLSGVLLFGIAYMAPLIVLGTFGVVATTTEGTVPSAYVVALVAMLFTAASYGKMAATHPVAGSAYTYVRKAVDSRVGFLVGWAVLLDYFFLPMVIWLIGGAYLSAQFPDVPSWLWLIAFIAITTVLNVLGIKIAEKANFILMAFQVLVIAFFIVLSLKQVLSDGHSLASGDPFFHPGSTFGTISGGAALATYSFLGFDAVTTLTEEAVEPKRTIPRAILLTALIGGGVFIVLAYVTQLVHPGSSFADESSAAFEIAGHIGGNAFAAFFLAGLVVAQFASGIAAQASASRLMFAMGRDGVLPRIFGRLQPKLHTPAFAIGLTGLVGLIALALDVTTSTSFINFGAFTAFTMVNVSVIATWLRTRHETKHNVLTWLVAPVIGAVIDLWLLVNLDGLALTFGLVWLGIGIAYLVVLTRGFRRPPPEMTFEE